MIILLANSTTRDSIEFVNTNHAIQDALSRHSTLGFHKNLACHAKADTTWHESIHYQRNRIYNLCKLSSNATLNPQNTHEMWVVHTD